MIIWGFIFVIIGVLWNWMNVKSIMIVWVVENFNDSGVLNFVLMSFIVVLILNVKFRRNYVDYNML